MPRPSPDVSIRRHSAGDLFWDFRSGKPLVNYAKGRTCEVDPFPAYAHDLATATETLTRVSVRWPLSVPVNVHVLDREEVARSNGFTSEIEKYSEHSDGRSGHFLDSIEIVLCGKRIPPHPAVTRYLVAHEYGHAVMFAMAAKYDKSYAAIVDDYAEIRTLEPSGRTVGGGEWHTSPGEVMACDFRLTQTRIESEYWPHLGVPMPGQLPDVVAWWAKTEKEFFGD